MSFELTDLSENNREFDEDEHDNILRKADKILESEKLKMDLDRELYALSTGRKQFDLYKRFLETLMIN